MKDYSKTLDKAKSLLLSLKNYPQQYALIKESFIIRVSTILEMILDDFVANEFYIRHLKTVGCTYVDLNKSFDDEWACKVVDDALSLIETIATRNER
jgi:hypothetical protein